MLSYKGTLKGTLNKGVRGTALSREQLRAKADG